MAVMKKSDFEKLTTPEALDKKIVELERAMLELRSEGNGSKCGPLKTALAQLQRMRSTTKSASPKPK